MQAWTTANPPAVQPSSGKSQSMPNANGASNPAEFGSDIEFVFPSLHADDSLASLTFANTDPAGLLNGHAGSRCDL